MFSESSSDDIQELRNNTTSRIIIGLVVLAASEHLRTLKAMRSDTRDYMTLYEGKRAAFFEAAFIVEKECWGSSDFTQSYKEIILAVSKNNRTLYDAITELEGWIKQARDHGF